MIYRSSALGALIVILNASIALFLMRRKSPRRHLMFLMNAEVKDSQVEFQQKTGKIGILKGAYLAWQTGRF